MTGKQFLLTIILLGGQVVFGQQKFPIIKAISKSVNIKDGNHFRKGYWYIMPEKKPDHYYVEIPRKEHTVTFYTDIDSISFNVKYGEKYDFIILLNNKDSCYTQVIAVPKQLLNYKKDCNNCIITHDTIPFIIGDNNKIFIKGKVNNSQLLDFQFDLGGSDCGIKKSSVEKSNLKLDGDDKNNTTKNSFNQLNIAKLKWDSLPFYIGDNMSSKEDGIVGNSLFQDKIVEINYDKKLIIVYDTLPEMETGYSKHEMILDGVVPFIEGTLVSSNQAPCKIWFMFDTGDSGNGLVTDEVAAKNNLYNSVHKIIGFGKRDIVVFPKLMIGNYAFNGISGIIEKTSGNTTNVSLLGNALLKRFNVIIDNKNGYIYLKPNSLFNDPFEHPEMLIQKIIAAAIILVAALIAFIVYKKIKARRKAK